MKQPENNLQNLRTPVTNLELFLDPAFGHLETQKNKSDILSLPFCCNVALCLLDGTSG